MHIIRNMFEFTTNSSEIYLYLSYTYTIPCVCKFCVERVIVYSHNNERKGYNNNLILIESWLNAKLPFMNKCIFIHYSQFHNLLIAWNVNYINIYIECYCNKIANKYICVTINYLHEHKCNKRVNGIGIQNFVQL